MLQQFLPYAVEIDARLVDLVHRHDDRHTGRLGVADCLDGLRHNAVIGCDHQHHHVGDARAAGAHRRKRGVARRVEEGDAFASRHLHLVGADVLGDAAGLARGHVGLAQRVEQAGLAVIDMAHDGHDRRPGHHVGVDVGITLKACFHVRLAHALHTMTEFLNDQLRRVGVDTLGQCRHDAHAKQRLHHLDATRGHAVGELGDGYGLWDDDVARHLFLARTQARQLLLAAVAFARTTHRRNRTATLILAFDGGRDVDAAGTTAVSRRKRRLARGRRDRTADAARAGRATGAAHRAAAIVLGLILTRSQRQPRGRRAGGCSGRGRRHWPADDASIAPRRSGTGGIRRRRRRSGCGSGLSSRRVAANLLGLALGLIGPAAILFGAARGLLGGTAHHQGLLLALLALTLRLDAAVFLQHALANGHLVLG